MKVTKVIREYIEEEIDKKIKEHPEMLKLLEEAKQEQEAWEKDVEPFKKEIEQKLLELAEKHQMFYEGYNGTKSYPYVTIHNESFSHLPAHKKMQQLENKLRKDRDKAVRDICFKLEMGAKKDQIQDMLDEISF